MLELVEELTGITVDSYGVLKEVAYIGDDLPDLECLKVVEYSACPADATKELKDNVKFISSKNGGQGAVREFIEWLISLL
jgi:3-deoxy-D-manno-octulosonate 8-phosphate phosphatase KdsC-like HAD superfamily phosphatase